MYLHKMPLMILFFTCSWGLSKWITATKWGYRFGIIKNMYFRKLKPTTSMTADLTFTKICYDGVKKILRTMLYMFLIFFISHTISHDRTMFFVLHSCIQVLQVGCSLASLDEWWNRKSDNRNVKGQGHNFGQILNLFFYELQCFRNVFLMIK